MLTRGTCREQAFKRRITPPVINCYRYSVRQKICILFAKPCYCSQDRYSRIARCGRMTRSKYADETDDGLFYMLKGPKREAEAAFSELYNRYSPRIHAYCLRVVGNYEQAEDIFQETFLRFYKSAQVDRNMTNVPGFLLRIARNLCLNYKRDKRDTVAIDNFHFASKAHSHEQAEMLDLIAMALELLEVEYREAFVLREYDGLSYKEISQIVGDSVSAVKTRVFRAKQQVRTILSPYLKDLAR